MGTLEQLSYLSLDGAGGCGGSQIFCGAEERNFGGLAPSQSALFASLFEQTAAVTGAIGRRRSEEVHFVGFVLRFRREFLFH